MNYYAVPPLLQTGILLFMAVFVLIKNWKSMLNVIFALFCLCMAIWLFGFSLMYFCIENTYALLWARVGFIGIAFIPFVAFHFVTVLINRRSILIPYIYLITIPSIAINFTTPYIYQGVAPHFWGYYPVAGKFYFVFVILYAFFMSWGSYLLITNRNNSQLSVLRRQQIRYIMVAVIIGVFAVVDYIAKFPGIEIYPFGYIASAFFMLMTAYAIVKYRLMDIQVVITRAGIFLSVYTLVLGIPFFIGVMTGEWLLATIITAILASTGPLLYHFLKSKAEAILLAKQRHYQKVILQASEGMIRLLDIQKILNFVVDVVQKSMDLKYAAVYLSAGSPNYKLTAVEREQSVILPDALSNNEVMTDYLSNVKKPIYIEDHPCAIPKELETHRVQLIVPFHGQHGLIGFMVLGEKQDKALFAKDDIEVLRTLANQAALAIENCQHLEEFRHAQEKIFAAEKLASIGGMAEGIAHQISNQICQVNLNSEALRMKVERYASGNPEAVSNNAALNKLFEDLKTIAGMFKSSVERMTNTVKGIMNYSTIEISERDFSWFSINDIVGPALELLKIKHHCQDFPLKVHCKDCDGQLYGVKAQLMEALYNMMDNAYEATLEKKAELKDQEYKPEITVTVKQNPTGSRTIEIKDNGMGIKEENKPKIFAPFYSTKTSKKSGAGIGMYIVKRMIEESHKGKIELQSEYGSGTTLQVSLPTA